MTTLLDGTGDAVEAPKSVWYGRALLIFVAAAYGSLSVAFKYVYSMPGPPSAGTIGAVRGVMAALCFIPMLLKDKKAGLATRVATFHNVILHQNTLRVRNTGADARGRGVGGARGCRGACDAEHELAGRGEHVVTVDDSQYVCSV